jgi:cell division protease FtsH
MTDGLRTIAVNRGTVHGVSGLFFRWAIARLWLGVPSYAMHSLAGAVEDGSPQLVAPLLTAHFKPTTASDITITERRFPFRMRADLQRTIDKVFGGEIAVKHFFGVRTE